MWDIASRISHQIEVCSWRLKQISEAYTDQLFAKVEHQKYRIGERFEDGFTWLAYLSIQAFLVDACVLRDYLSEFYALYLCFDKSLTENISITSMGTLKKRVLNKIVSPDQETNALQVSTSVGGWLYKLGSYRDLVVHSAPLAQAQNRLFAVLEELPFEGGALPAVRLPIPTDPDGASKYRASGTHYSDFEEHCKLFMRASDGEIESSDGLTYCHGVLKELMQLAKQFGDRSPIEPKMPVFDKTNIIGDIKIATE